MDGCEAPEVEHLVCVLKQDGKAKHRAAVCNTPRKATLDAITIRTITTSIAILILINLILLLLHLITIFFTLTTLATHCCRCCCCDAR